MPETQTSERERLIEKALSETLAYTEHAQKGFHFHRHDDPEVVRMCVRLVENASTALGVAVRELKALAEGMEG